MTRNYVTVEQSRAGEQPKKAPSKKAPKSSATPAASKTTNTNGGETASKSEED